MSIHIGQIIQKAVKAKGISVVDFADSINYTRSNAYKIFEKETIDTGLLIRISELLGDNLFFHYIKESEVDERFNERLKVKLSLKVWDNFMQAVKSGEQKSKSAKPTVKNKAPKKAVKKAKK